MQPLRAGELNKHPKRLFTAGISCVGVLTHSVISVQATLMEHVPRLVEIGSGPHITLDNLASGVNCRVRCGSPDDRQQCTDMSVTIHTSEALLGM